MRAAGVELVRSSRDAGRQRAALLAAVERSPQAAAARDRAGWVGLFTADGRIEDPVGSRPHVGHAQIGRFYDTFIGPRDITFHRDLDIVSGPVVLRDLELEVAMGPAVTMHIPALLRYDLEEDLREDLAEVKGQWQIAAAAGLLGVAGDDAAIPAQRTASAVARPAIVPGPAGQPGVARHRGFRDRLSDGWVRGKRSWCRYFSAPSRATTCPPCWAALSPTAAITLGDDDALGLAELGAQLDGAAVTKMNGAGSTVAVSLTSGHGRAIMFADVAWRRNAINRIRYFPA